MNYKIIAFNEETGRIKIKPQDYSIIEVDLPVDENGHVYEGAELRHYLRGFLPTHHVERRDKLLSGIKNAHKIHALVEPHEEEKVEIFQTQSRSDNFKMKVLSVLFEEGLIK